MHTYQYFFKCLLVVGGGDERVNRRQVCLSEVSHFSDVRVSYGVTNFLSVFMYYVRNLFSDDRAAD